MTVTCANRVNCYKYVLIAIVLEKQLPDSELPDCVVKASTCFIFRRLVDGLDLQKYCLVCD